MSFVLEALKKQEAGQDPDAAVSLARQAVERRRHRLWAGLFAVAVVVNAGLLLWMFGMPWLENSGPAKPATANQAAAGGPVEPAQPAGRSSDSAAAPAAAAQTAQQDGPLAAGPAQRGPRPSVPEPAAERAPRVRDVSLQNLPADARTRFPGIAFTTHIYSEDTDLRAIVANGQRLQEGDRVRGLEIVAITEDGVVLAFENYRVSVPIATDW